MTTHDWADEVLGMTLTLVRGPGLRQVGEVLRFRWDTERTTTFRGAADEQASARIPYAVQVGALGGWTVLVEPNGYAAGTPDVVARLSSGGTAVSLFWTVNLAMGVVLARDGAVVRSFDPLLYDLGPVGNPLPEEEGLAFGDPEADPRRAALTLLERLTGVRLERRWVLDDPRPTWTTQGQLPAAGSGPVVPGALLPEAPPNG